MSKEVMRMALNALIDLNEISKNGIALPAEIDTAIEALRTALAQPEMDAVLAERKERTMKPVAWIKIRELWYMKSVAEHGKDDWQTNLGLKPEPDDEGLYTETQVSGLIELLARCENEMRYAGWGKYEADNFARNEVYEEVKEFLK